MPRVQMKYFAIAREISGCSGEELELADGATTEDVWAVLLKRYPGMEAHRDHSRLAINMQYVNSVSLLNNNDEVSVIPPVSGG